MIVGFICEIHLPETPKDSVLLVDWIAPTDEYVPRDAPIARLLCNGEPSVLICNMPVIIHEKIALPGVELSPGTLVAKVEAEGEEIPYGRPYSRIERAA